jgi:DNA-binding NtrC family response regulator
MSSAAILLVDDEKTVLDGLRDELTRHFGRRFTYETAENAEEAWEVIEELVGDGFRLVLIVSDMIMPHVRGDEFLTAVRERYPEVVRVLLTGHSEPEGLERARSQAKVRKILFKPWSAAELRDLVEEAVA